MKFKIPFLKTKAASVKFYINNLPVEVWPVNLTTADTSPAGIVRTFEQTPDLFQITDYIATIVANLPIKIVKPNGNPSKNTELQALINQPNYYQNWKELIKQFVVYYELLGNGYFYSIIPEGMKTISELFVLPSQAVGVVLLQDKRKPSWQNKVARYKVTIGGFDYYLEPDSVLHKRYINLQYEEGSYIYGMSKYVPGNAIATELKAIYDAKTSILNSRGALGILSNESLIPDADQSNAIKEKLAENYGLKSGQSKVIVTTQKLNYQQIGLGLDELRILENAKYSFEALCRLNNFDPVIFSTEGSTFANKKEAKKDAMKNVIKPKVDDIYNDLNIWLSPYFGGDRIEPDWSMVEELQADMKLLTDIAKIQVEMGVITPYEAYKLIYNKEPEHPDISDEYKTAKKEEPNPDQQQDVDFTKLLKPANNGS